MLFSGYLVASSSTSLYSPSTQRQARVIHTSKKKIVIETRGGRTATKTKTIVTSNVVKNEDVDYRGMRRSGRAKNPTNKKIESMPSPARTLTNGTLRTVKYQSNLLAELSKKSTNYSPDVVSDLEEILGSPIKTRTEQVSRGQSKIEHMNAKSGGLPRVDHRMQTDDDETKPATRSSKRLSNRVQPVVEPVTKQPKSNSRKKNESTSYNATLSSEESQLSQDVPFGHLQIRNHTPETIVMNVKQEKEVSYTMTDENHVFTCEMCSAVFSDRAQLLVHVPVHI